MEKLLNEYMMLDEVDAVLLGGSRANNTHDEKSDYDYYVYLNSPLEESKRRRILEKYCGYMEYSNHFWELEDDGVLLNGIEIEFIYRDIDSIEESLVNLLVKGQVNQGYTTCFLDNILDSVIVFDKTKRLQKLKNRFKDGVTKELAQKIVDSNFPLLYQSMPALYKQVKKAVERNDQHSINHRITVFFELYYDILFAINLEPHPGEKRMLEYAKTLKLLPCGFPLEVENVFNKMFRDNNEVLKSLMNLSINMETLLQDQKYL